jgi:Tol biopolymer transport system component
MKKNVSEFMRLLSLTIVLALVMPVMVHAQAGKANFAGTWAMNAEKSTIPQGGGGGGGGRGMGGGNFTVAQEANLLTQTRTGQDGTARVTKYTLDGKESVNTTGGGESKSTAKWSADGKTLTVVTKTNFNGNERTITAVWSLIDAKTLSIASTRQGQNGEVKSTIVYDKN